MILAVCNLDKPYLNIPTDAKTGKRSLKLEKLAENNGITHDFAHDAMSDVDATVDLSNIIKKNEPELWEHMIQFKSYKNVNEYIKNNDVLIMPPTNATGEYIPVSLVTSNPDNAKEIILYNLNEEVTDDVINSRTRSIGGLFKNKILKKIKSNDYPIFLQEKHMNTEQKKEYIKNKELYKTKSKLIRSSSNFIMNVNQYLVDQLADYQIDSRDYMSASEHVDEMLYNGFTGPSDWKKIQQLGNVDNPYIYLKHADLYVLSSISELFPTSLIESLVFKINILSTNCDYGPSEILENGKWGYLVPVKNTKLMSNSIINLISNDKKIDNLKRAYDFDLEVLMTKYVKLIEDNYD